MGREKGKMWGRRTVIWGRDVRGFKEGVESDDKERLMKEGLAKRKTKEDCKRMAWKGK